MKIILSRKGFDSAAGGVPSPIFPDGSMYSIPIQAPGGTTQYAQIRKGDPRAGTDMATAVRSLARDRPGRFTHGAPAHFDPDLDPGALERPPGWRPSLGQVNAAQGHLSAQGVGIDDVFVFFGWFRRVERAPAGGWRYERGAPDLHVIFGWLRIGELIDVPTDARARRSLLEARPWLAPHPHLNFPRGYVKKGNRIYAGSDGGEFRAFDERLVLTAPGAGSRREWLVPSWFGAGPGRPPMSYHAQRDRWTRDGSRWRVRTVGRGQEFVLDCANRPEAGVWLAHLIGARIP